MRGESKYHYVDLTLLDDRPETEEEAFSTQDAYPEMSRSKG